MKKTTWIKPVSPETLPPFASEIEPISYDVWLALSDGQVVRGCCLRRRESAADTNPVHDWFAYHPAYGSSSICCGFWNGVTVVAWELIEAPAHPDHQPQSTATATDDHIAFEAYCDRNDFDKTRASDHENYLYSVTQTRWLAWCEALKVARESYACPRIQSSRDGRVHWCGLNGPQVSAPDGWKLVPVEPTKEMLSAKDVRPLLVLGHPENSRVQQWRHGVWKAMLAAAPTPPVVQP
jgi:hypothetical protein